jgi:hypothetical protein
MYNNPAVLRHRVSEDHLHNDDNESGEVAAVSTMSSTELEPDNLYILFPILLSL